MRLRIANIKTSGPHNCDIGDAILAALPGGAVGYSFKDWPRIRVIYVTDKERDQ